MGQTDLKPTAQGQVESSINDTINFIMAKVAAGEIDAATATELIAAARKDYESNVPVTTSAQQAVYHLFGFRPHGGRCRSETRPY